jgi:hypothetical protein
MLAGQSMKARPYLKNNESKEGEGHGLNGAVLAWQAQVPWVQTTIPPTKQNNTS